MNNPLSAQLSSELLGYPETRWDRTPTDRWLSLCAQLRTYAPSHSTYVIPGERKWELVSALQKSIRRGEKQVALKMVSAMTNMPKQSNYFWRRLCVIACEDVGPGDDVLVSFVVACATVRPLGKSTYHVWCFLVEQMCDLLNRSRVYCSFSVVEAAEKNAQLPELTLEDARVVSAIAKQRSSIDCPISAWQLWQKKNDWRSEGLLKFLELRLSRDMILSGMPVPPYKMLFGLPSYAFDMHTRVGLVVLRKLLQRTDGLQDIRCLMQMHRVANPTKTLGEALFFVEGACIQHELIYPALCCFEQRVLAKRHGLSIEGWQYLCSLIKAVLNSGLLDQIRENVLLKTYRNTPADWTPARGLFDAL